MKLQLQLHEGEPMYVTRPGVEDRGLRGVSLDRIRNAAAASAR